MHGGWGVSYEIALRWIPLNLTDDKSTLVQVMAWCRQATSRYLSQCWPRSVPPYGVTRPQWVNPSGENKVNTIAADALAPCVVRTSVTMVLAMQDILEYCLPHRGISCHLTRGMIRNTNIFFWFSKNKFITTRVKQLSHVSNIPMSNPRQAF